MVPWLRTEERVRSLLDTGQGQAGGLGKAGMLRGGRNGTCMDPEARETLGKHPGHHLMARVVARTTEYFVWDLRLPTHPQCISTAFKYMRLELRPSSFKSASEFTMALLLLFCGHCVFSQSNADKWLLSCLLRFSPQQPPACLSSLGCPPVLWAQLPPPPTIPSL